MSIRVKRTGPHARARKVPWHVGFGNADPTWCQMFSEISVGHDTERMARMYHIKQWCIEWRRRGRSRGRLLQLGTRALINYCYSGGLAGQLAVWPTCVLSSTQMTSSEELQ